MCRDGRVPLSLLPTLNALYYAPIIVMPQAPNTGLGSGLCRDLTPPGYPPCGGI